jgi:hypothetical protein
MSYGFLQRWRPSSRTAVVAADGPLRRTFALHDIERGWVVRDSTGRRLGTVAGAGPDSLRVKRGLWRAPLAVPVAAIHEVRQGELTLNASREALEARQVR